MKSYAFRSWSILVSITALSLAWPSLASALDPVPQIAQPLVPASARPGSDGFTLTVNGAGFVRNSQVFWDGSALATTFVSATQLQAKVTSSDLESPGTALVTVADPGGVSSNVQFFEITSPRKQVTFAVTIPPSEFSQRVVAADLNLDGKLDLVSALSVNGQVGVRLGDGAGHFGQQALLSTPANPDDVVVGDFNNDGIPDIASVAIGTVSVLIGTGSGFLPHVDSAIDPLLQAFGIAAGDFNQDGKLDLVVGYQDAAANSISILLGNGDGTFQAPSDYSAGNEPGSVAVADLNHDGKLDIVAANFASFVGNTISVLLGNGDGTFQPQVQYMTSHGALSVIVADFNHDGNPDLAVDCACGFHTCGSPGEISVLLGHGDGTFANRMNFPVDGFPYTVSAGDYNGDGILDLLVPSLDLNQVNLLTGNGNGTFAPAITFASTESMPVGVAPGDFDRDGKLDAVIGTATGLTFLHNR